MKTEQQVLTEYTLDSVHFDRPMKDRRRKPKDMTWAEFTVFAQKLYTVFFGALDADCSWDNRDPAVHQIVHDILPIVRMMRKQGKSNEWIAKWGLPLKDPRFLARFPSLDEVLGYLMWVEAHMHVNDEDIPSLQDCFTLPPHRRKRELRQYEKLQAHEATRLRQETEFRRTLGA